MKKKVTMICWDMDGTIADLYSVENWLEQLENQIVNPYKEAKTMLEMNRLLELLQKATEKGIELRVITWLAKNATREYKKETRKAKKDWLVANGFNFDKVHCVQYGTTKADCVRKEIPSNRTAILIDDNAKVRKGWTLGGTLNPTEENFLDKLEKIIEKN